MDEKIEKEIEGELWDVFSRTISIVLFDQMDKIDQEEVFRVMFDNIESRLREQQEEFNKQENDGAMSFLDKIIGDKFKPDIDGIMGAYQDKINDFKSDLVEVIKGGI